MKRKKATYFLKKVMSKRRGKIKLFYAFTYTRQYSIRHRKCPVNKETHKIMSFYSILGLKKTGDMYMPSG